MHTLKAITNRLEQSNVKTKMETPSNFMAFSYCMNFKSLNGGSAVGGLCGSKMHKNVMHDSSQGVHN